MSQEMLDRILNTVIDINVNMDRRFEKVFDHFDRLVDRMGAMEQNVTGVEQKLDSVERRLNRVEDRLERVEQRLEGVETAVLETSLIVKGHEEQIGQMERGE